MKAAQFSEYGGPEVIKVNDTPKPTLKDGQVLVKVHAASINAIDWKIRAGYLAKMSSVQFPFTIGGDFAGTVIKTGKDVKEVKAGDEVYGQAIVLGGGSGSVAEFVAANAKNTAAKPQKANWEEAAALPLVGTSAIQALEEHMNLQKGQKILIHGGAGGIGHIAIQVAKALGAHVATTASAKDSAFVKGLGADEVIDYKSQQFEEIIKNFDAVFDTVGGEAADKSFKVLKNGGIFVSMVGKPDEELAEKYHLQAIGQFSKTATSQLNRLSELVDSGKVKVHVSKTFPLEKVQDAFIYQEKNHPQGKVVVKITT